MFPAEISESNSVESKEKIDKSFYCLIEWTKKFIDSKANQIRQPILERLN